jgi:hypothetical protein
MKKKKEAGNIERILSPKICRQKGKKNTYTK